MIELSPERRRAIFIALRKIHRTLLCKRKDSRDLAAINSLANIIVELEEIITIPVKEADKIKEYMPKYS